MSIGSDKIKSKISEVIDNMGKEYGGKRYLEIDSEDTMKLTAGDNTIRIMPPIDPDDFYGKVIYVHNNIGLDEDSYLCLAKNFGELCPICDHQKVLKRKGADESDIKALYPKKRYLFNVVDMDEPKKGVRLLNCPPTLAEQILRQSKNQRTGEILNVSDINEGYDIFINREGEGLVTKYHATIDRDSTPIENKKWLDELIDLEAVIVKPTAEDMLASLGVEEVSGRIKDEDEDEPEATTRRARVRRTEEVEDGAEEAGKERGSKGAAQEAEETEKEEVSDIRARLRQRIKRN